VNAGWMRALLLATTTLLACSHQDELEALAEKRMLVPKPTPSAPSPVSEVCLTVLGPTPGVRLGPAQDAVPSTPAVDVALSVRVAPSCTASALKVGLCQRDPAGNPIAPEQWSPDTLMVEPGREYGPTVALPLTQGPYLPCAYLDQVYAVPVERVCEGAELLCPSDSGCYADTQTNPKRCGASCTECPGTADGEPVCSAGACGITCAQGFRDEARKCRARPACKGLEKACRGDDCCAIDLIDEGAGQPLKVKRGYDKSDSAEGLPEFQSADSVAVTVSPFWMDRYEVTVARFRRFVDAYEGWRAADNPKEGYGAHPAVATSGWPIGWSTPGVIEGFAKPIYVRPASRADLIASITKASCAGTTTWSEAAGPTDNMPINCVNYWLAYLYCIWDGESTSSRLPTEAEWNAAAAGGDQQRAYPWSEPPASRDIKGKAEFGFGDRLPFEVGASVDGRGRWKTLDLAGNVWEWVRDSSAPPTDGPSHYVDDLSDPIELLGDYDPATWKVLRGGSFKDFSCPTCEPQARLRTSAREVLRPYNSYNDTGIRCVRTYRN